MTDSEFLRYLQNEKKIEYYVFGCTGMWKIIGTCLTLHEKERLKEETYGYSGESQWYIATTRFTVVVKTAEWRTPLEEFWNKMEWVWAETEGQRLDEWFSESPDW